MSDLDVLLAEAAPPLAVRDEDLTHHLDALVADVEAHSRRRRRQWKYGIAAAITLMLGSSGAIVVVSTGSTSADYAGTTASFTFPDDATCRFSFAVQGPNPDDPGAIYPGDALDDPALAAMSPAQRAARVAAAQTVLAGIDFSTLSTTPAAPAEILVGDKETPDSLRERELRSIEDQVEDRLAAGMAAQGLTMDGIGESIEVSCSDGDTGYGTPAGWTRSDGTAGD